MPLADRTSYRNALQALRAIKDITGNTPQVKAIAAFLLEAANAEYPGGYVGDPSDPRDRAVVEAQRDYWQRFMAGEDVEENYYDL
jgi:hypothetical protein